jgi:predicted ATPase
VCIDEPENFLGLPEIQPWLDALRDQLEDADGRQAILVSHHPKMINFLASDLGVWVNRKDGTGPSQAQPVRTEAKSGELSVSQLVERGWIYDA